MSVGILAGLAQAVVILVEPYIEPSLDQQLREQDAAEASRYLHRYYDYEDEPTMEM